MIQVNISEIKTHFSRYAKRVKAGETVVLCDHNVPFAEIRPLNKRRKKRRFGLAKEAIQIGPAFFQADEEIARSMTEGEVFPRLEHDPK